MQQQTKHRYRVEVEEQIGSFVVTVEAYSEEGAMGLAKIMGRGAKSAKVLERLDESSGR